MKIDVEIDEADLRRLVLVEIVRRMGDVQFNPDDVKIEVMSRQNYRVKEWEYGSFRARLTVNTLGKE